jgi:hypothetical protein
MPFARQYPERLKRQRPALHISGTLRVLPGTKSSANSKTSGLPFNNFRLSGSLLYVPQAAHRKTVTSAALQLHPLLYWQSNFLHLISTR